MHKLTWMAAVLAMGLVGCGSRETSDQAETSPAAPVESSTAGATAGVGATRAVATLQTAQGANAGTATATPAADGIMVALNVEGLPAGSHGAHVHMTGRCDAPTFESAGDHWNPANAKHGLENPQGQHAGDMPNLTIDASGRGTLNYTLKGGSFDGLLDADGAAMVIHTAADDQKTDPSGNSGGRIACGVFAAG